MQWAYHLTDKVLESLREKCGTKLLLMLLCMCLLVAPSRSGLLLSKCVLSLGEERISHPHQQVATVLCWKAASSSAVFLDTPQVFGTWVVSSSLLLNMVVLWRSLADSFFPVS